MDSKSLFMYGLMATGACLVDADLRMACQPRNNYVVRQRNPNVQFQTTECKYIEPDTFGYKGLVNQRDGGAYDQFVRSNIDNEQDKRDFHREAGRDHLPVRTLEAVEDSSSAGVKNKLPAGAAGTITATPGTPFLVPLRWNNPHAAELEVNVWIKDMTVVVPVKKPTCAGEGRQDAVFAFTIPTDFNTAIPARVPGFTGCKQVGDCVLQIYAHSVEPRQYAIGTPLIVTGNVDAPTTGAGNIEAARADPGTELKNQPNDLCLSSTSPDADIKNAVPRAARHISDQANHAYQNNNYSPYSGQQPEAISKNLQASVIISMIPANRGELGRALLAEKNGAAAAFAANLRNKEQNLVKQYEGIVNNIIAKIGNDMKNTATLGVGGVQKTVNSFRAAELGAINSARIKTNTYVPSFKITDPALLATAKGLVPAKYAGLIDADGQVKIYEAVLNDLKAEFNKAATLGLNYLGPVLKPTKATLDDVTGFKKLNAKGGRDRGSQYATEQYNAAQAARLAAIAAQAKFTVTTTPLMSALSGAEDGSGVDFDLETFSTNAEKQLDTSDMDAYNADCPEDDDAIENPGPCTPKQFFSLSADGSGSLVLASEQSNAATTVTSSIVAFACSAIAAIFLA